MRVIVAGSFCHFHRGHKKMIERAIEIADGDYVYIGLCADDFVRKMGKNYCCSYEEREKKIEEFVSRLTPKFKILPINDIFGFALGEGFDALVVSEETLKNGLAINEKRKAIGLTPLKIYVVPMEIAEDLMPISAKRIEKGVIDSEGRRLREVEVGVGTTNPVKINAVKKVLSNYFPRIKVEAVSVDSEVSPQPKSIGETMLGSLNRALKSLQNRDYGVGIEAGVVYYEDFGVFLDIQFCFIVDSLGRFSFGHGSGFLYPPKFNEELIKGKEIADIMEEISGIKEIRKKMGAIGYLTHGVLDRTSLTEQSVIMAMVPRINSHLYEFWSSDVWKVERALSILKR